MLSNPHADFIEKYSQLPAAHKVVIKDLVESYLGIKPQSNPQPEPKAEPAKPQKITLWRINNIADYFGMSRATIEQKIISCPDFPRPFTTNKTQPRWMPEEVIKWSQRKRG